MKDEDPQTTAEVAEEYLIDWMRNPRNTESYGTYGYEFYLPIIIRSYLLENGAPHHISPSDPRAEALSPYFYAAAWELCRRGVLRPGIRRAGLQATDDGASGNGYSLTPFGKKWLSAIDFDVYVPTEPGRYSDLLEPFRDRFGSAFQQRGQEAVRCYRANAWLACCAMCGAAAESILLAAAFEKRGEEETLKVYDSTGGRQKVQKDLLAHAPKRVRNDFNDLSRLMHQWRDDSAHGKAVQIENNQAFILLATLLRLARLADDEWSVITSRSE